MLNDFSQDIQKIFWSKVQFNYYLDGTIDCDACMIWNAYRDRNGYGLFTTRFKTYRAHRLSYLFIYDEIEDNLDACHICDNPSCVNPFHIWLGTNIENHKDMAIKQRSTIGSKNPRSKLTEDQILFILQQIISNKFTKSEQIMAHFHVGRQFVSNLLNGKIWKHISLPFLESYNITFLDLQNKLYSTCSGEYNGRSKLTEDEVRLIKLKIQNGESLKSLSLQFNISQPTLSSIKRNKIWQHVII